MNWKAWLKGLAAAALSGAATGAAQVSTTTGTVDKGTGVVASAGAIVGTLLYLLKSPVQVGGVTVTVDATKALEKVAETPEAK